ncbi:MAG: hypothetical protein DMG64_20210 [Acidobacteria bacterium]|nr:MAG: hypothetical protein DMG64_20210 [Acidobacteriota bacterium]PYY23977.1 MAG: hypothetical protein DMG62_05920 [Acidobacteriota bacterium]
MVTWCFIGESSHRELRAEESCIGHANSGAGCSEGGLVCSLACTTTLLVLMTLCSAFIEPNGTGRGTVAGQRFPRRMLPELLTTKDKRMRIWNSLFCQEIPMTASTVPSMPAASQSFANIQVMQLTTAYWTSRCVHVVAELGVADHIGDLPQSTESLAKASGIRPDALHRVLRLLASVGIFEWKDNAWHHNEASRFLRSDHPASLRDYVRMLGLPVFWSAFEELEHSLRTGESAFAKRHAGGVFTYLAEHSEECHIFDAAMSSKSHRDIAAILPVYDFSQFATISDIAGGRGHLLRAILRTSPTTQGILFDQPHVVAEVVPERGEKLEVVSGDFFSDCMPRADAYLLMNIIHDWRDADSIKILSAIRRDMPPHARVLLIETVVPSTPGPHLSKELDIAMMVLPGGKERTEEEYAELAAKCFLRLKRVVETMGPIPFWSWSPFNQGTKGDILGAPGFGDSELWLFKSVIGGLRL